MDKTYQNPALSPEERAADLLSRMTDSEKLAQLSAIFMLEDVAKKIGDGSFPADGFGGAYMAFRAEPEEVNRLQRYQIEHTRLGIPFLLSGEATHGFMYDGATIFPQAIALGATFDKALMREIADTIGEEARMAGVRQVYAPDLDISRDPRWGRVEENYGEDPYLTGELGVAYIQALQKHQVAATAKHFLAHGSPEGGINCAPSHVGEREVREVMLPAFARAVQEGGCMSIMPAYHELDGIPMHGSPYWLRTVLREELGFEGFTVADYGGIDKLISEHHVAATALDAGVTAMGAGVDFEIPEAFGYGEAFLEAARSDAELYAMMDDAVRRILTVKFRLGLFENPYVEPEKIKELRSPRALALARRAAAESAVLLKNNGILPLSEDISRILVTGPNADYAQMGDYTPQGAENYAVSVRAGLASRLGDARVAYVKGTSIAGELDIEAAVKASAEADVAIVVLGDNSNSWYGKNWGDSDGGDVVTCGENFDSSTLLLPGVQRELLRRLKAAGSRIVLILMTGRPYCIAEEAELADAVIQAFYPGEQGGHALADILFGDADPSGRLPISFPRSTGMLPCYYNYKPTSRGRYVSPDQPPTDRDGQNPAALFPFGYGLSYTEFRYRDLTVDGRTVTVTVENVGRRTGRETVMLFLRAHTCPVTPFVRQLRGFEKLTLAPGESQTVRFPIRDADVSYIGADMKECVNHGRFTAYVGDLRAEFTV